MEKIKNNKVLYFVAQFIANTVFAMIIWPLLDMFFRTVIDKKEFVYSVRDHIFSSIIYGIMLTIFLTIMRNNAAKKVKSSNK